MRWDGMDVYCMYTRAEGQGAELRGHMRIWPRPGGVGLFVSRAEGSSLGSARMVGLGRRRGWHAVMTSWRANGLRVSRIGAGPWRRLHDKIGEGGDHGEMGWKRGSCRA